MATTDTNRPSSTETAGTLLRRLDLEHAAIGAVVGAGCRPCLIHHLDVACEQSMDDDNAVGLARAHLDHLAALGITERDRKRAVNLACAVQRTAGEMTAFNLPVDDPDTQQPDGAAACGCCKAPSRAAAAESNATPTARATTTTLAQIVHHQPTDLPCTQTARR